MQEQAAVTARQELKKSARLIAQLQAELAATQSKESTAVSDATRTAQELTSLKARLADVDAAANALRQECETVSKKIGKGEVRAALRFTPCLSIAVVPPSQERVRHSRRFEDSQNLQAHPFSSGICVCRATPSPATAPHPMILRWPLLQTIMSMSMTRSRFLRGTHRPATHM